MKLADKIIALHDALDTAAVPHAFGGALALAWCTQRARGTIDIDINIFMPHGAASEGLAALPDAIAVSDEDRAVIARDGQTRLWWDRTPIDLFWNTTDFHSHVGRRARIESFSGRDVPFLACEDLAVFKAFFNRTKDWADLEEMAAAGTLDIPAVVGVLRTYIGEDERLDRLIALRST